MDQARLNQRISLTRDIARAADRLVADAVALAELREKFRGNDPDDVDALRAVLFFRERVAQVRRSVASNLACVEKKLREVEQEFLAPLRDPDDLRDLLSGQKNLFVSPGPGSPDASDRDHGAPATPQAAQRRP